MQPAAIEHVRALYAPADDPVFDLVPASFDHYANALYKSMGSPILTRESLWQVYRELLYRFQNLDAAIAFTQEWQDACVGVDDLVDPAYDLLSGLRELHNGLDSQREDGSYYMGGVNNGEGLGDSHLFNFSLLD